MIKDKYKGLTLTVQNGSGNRKIFVHDGMTIEEIEFLEKNGTKVLKETKKIKKVKMVEPKEEETTEEDEA